MERELVKAILANEALIALTGYDRAARAGVLDRAEPLLNQQQCRVVRLRSYGDQPLDLQAAMNQVVAWFSQVAPVDSMREEAQVECRQQQVPSLSNSTPNRTVEVRVKQRRVSLLANISYE